MTAEENYLKYFDDEAYLLDEVAPRFRETGHIDPADFYMMLIWKHCCPAISGTESVG